MMLGERVGDYQITDVLGHGAQGIVYAAHHVALDRDAAVKVFLPQLARDHERVQRFFDEARATARLRHPGIVKVYEWGHDDRGRVYVAMERLRGETLYDRLRRAPLSLGEAVAIVRELAAALRVAHEHVDETGAPSPIAHRDLKPENIFLAHEGERVRVVIVDFGLAKLAGSRGDAVTWSGAGAFGTPPYMSPEQCRGDGGIDYRTDLYSLGCLLHEMVTGTPPFGFASAGELTRAHCTQEPPLLSEGALDVPAELETLACELLAKSRDARPATCAAVIARLDALGLATSTPLVTLGEVPVATIVPGRRTAPSGWFQRTWRRLLELPPWTAAGVTFVIGAVLLGVSTVAGVGDSYLLSLNWSLTYVVLAPLIVSFMVKVVQRSDAAVRDMMSRGMIEPREDVAVALHRFGGWLVGLTATLCVASIAICLGEWWHRFRRAPIPGTWWTDSVIVGGSGAVLQGVFIAAILGFVVHGLGWAQLLHGWTSPRSRLRLRTDPASADPRAGFELVEEPLLFSLVASVLVQITLYLSNVQHVAEVRGKSFFAVANPFASADLFDVGTGRYPSGVPVIASAMVAGFSLASVFVVRRAIMAAARAASPLDQPAWPLTRIGPRAMTAVLVLMFVITVFFKLAPFVLAALAVVALLQTSRRGPR